MDAVVGALAQCDRIAELCEQVPPAGEEFAMSVLESMEEVRATIERTSRVTPKQQEAIENWEDGLLKWLDDDIPF